MDICFGESPASAVHMVGCEFVATRMGDIHGARKFSLLDRYGQGILELFLRTRFSGGLNG